MTDYKQLCAELVHIADAFDSGTELASNQGQAMDGYSALAAFRDVAYRARAALTKTEPGEPTDEELLQVFDIVCLSEGGTVDEIHLRGLRAILARWGNHPGSPDSSLQPIPVSERLPEPEDCDGQGMCWWWHPSHRESDAPEGWMQRPREWGFVRVRYISDGALVCTHWLPAHALPLPTHA